MGGVTDTDPDRADDDLDGVLKAVGPRLRATRKIRGMTLPGVSKATGISVSTLSRLESGRRRLTLELLVPLARAYQVPLDDLVGARSTADPRLHGRPVSRYGMTFVPLSRRPGGPRAHKVILPPNWPSRAWDPRRHEGYAWLCVLSGRPRLLLGDQEIDLLPGEVAEFDTRLPHAFVNPRGEAVEMLGLFGGGGERLHVRARSRPARDR
jgi:transcriptional regulator with XRE-family HTH domain